MALLNILKVPLLSPDFQDISLEPHISRHIKKKKLLGGGKVKLVFLNPSRIYDDLNKL